jgi:transposase
MSFYQVVCFIQLSEAGVLSVFLQMYKIEYRVVIKLFVKEGLTANAIYSKFIKVYVDSSASFSTIKKWAAEFKRGRTSLEDGPLEGHPKSATTPEIIEQVHDMILDNQRIRVREIAETTGISKELVGYILHEELDMTKALRKMGAMFAYSRSKKYSHEKRKVAQYFFWKGINV